MIGSFVAHATKWNSLPTTDFRALTGNSFTTASRVG